jgi:hypothetical protein
MLTRLYRPMTPGGGAFLICVGAALISAAFVPWTIGGQLLIAGFIIGALAIMAVSIIGRRRGLPKPSPRDIVLVWIPVAIEAAAFIFLVPLVQDDFRSRMIVILAIVGAHFLPMVWSFGPMIAVLGVSCLGVAATGYLAPAIPTEALIATDGALKLCFGLAMFAALFRSSPSLSPSR